MEDLKDLLEIARQASKEASKAVLQVYNSNDFDIERKDDNSLLTKADRESHNIISSYLQNTGIPVLSEEGAKIAYDVRKTWQTLWIVDPLDGTKEFIKRNGEFTVNIALVTSGKPVLGVVEAPVLNTQFFGTSDGGAWVLREGKLSRLPEIPNLDHSKAGLRVVASRSHLNNETQEFLDSLNVTEILSMGSSLKFMLIAERKADIYPRFAPTMEWDTAAAHAIINSLNGNVVDANDNVLMYNKESLLNPFFKVY